MAAYWIVSYTLFHLRDIYYQMIFTVTAIITVASNAVIVVASTTFTVETNVGITNFGRLANLAD
jgi:hypothetical protein